MPIAFDEMRLLRQISVKGMAGAKCYTRLCCRLTYVRLRFRGRPPAGRKQNVVRTTIRAGRRRDEDHLLSGGVLREV